MLRWLALKLLAWHARRAGADPTLQPGDTVRATRGGMPNGPPLRVVAIEWGILAAACEARDGYGRRLSIAVIPLWGLVKAPLMINLPTAAAVIAADSPARVMRLARMEAPDA